MKIPSKSAAALVATTFVSMAPSVTAHSWVEYAKKLARNGTMVGDIGYPRGYVPRNSTDPAYSDSLPQNILPVSGQSYYSGNEIINKYQLEEDPEYPMLEAAAGDYVAIMHLENGHTTLPENQPKKPLNRGTIYFYGTTKPKDEEKLFDVHLLWDTQGTGGDGRGKLLATRNYDDGQCYQTNGGVISTERASKFAAQGAIHEQELACQSDIRLPDNLSEGDIYTIYWYWDWPDLNSDAIDINATTDGKFPWAGTFMRGDQDPNGFTMAAIARNESYSSVIDIKITGSSADSYSAKGSGSGSGSKILDYVPDQNIYSVGIKAQMETNFQIIVDDDNSTPSATTQITTPSATAPADGGSNGGAATVTITQTVRPPASVTTVYVTMPADAATEEPTSTTTTTKTLMVTRSVTSGALESVATPSTSTVTKVLTTHINAGSSSQSTSTYVLTMTTHINTPDSPAQTTSTVFKTLTTHISHSSATQVTYPGGQFRETPVSAESSTTSTSSDGAIVPTPFMRRRGNWAFGAF
ncbi:hypothetical protein B0J13DRAFT_226722 [Dactylonectria estremocensis]|uniref:DUF7492 domain-containing protein n=1 Tax=Dactylonectria estremocensis TaxID=1079267 RepID=A0A9P9F8T9_9HYPO|nr:hypothetical protein B0J13DRAFT_226722 [Dactylonectria estremocensis]